MPFTTMVWYAFALLWLASMLCGCAYHVTHWRRSVRRLKAYDRLLTRHARRHPRRFIAQCLFLLLVVAAFLMP
jgi:hypothetical protein